MVYTIRTCKVLTPTQERQLINKINIKNRKSIARIKVLRRRRCVLNKKRKPQTSAIYCYTTLVDSFNRYLSVINHFLEDNDEEYFKEAAKQPIDVLSKINYPRTIVFPLFMKLQPPPVLRNKIQKMSMKERHQTIQKFIQLKIKFIDQINKEIKPEESNCDNCGLHPDDCIC